MAIIKLAESMANNIPLEMDLATVRNCHGLIIGDSGSGKTYCTEHLCLEWIQVGFPVVVMDYSGSFKANQLENPLKKLEQDKKLHRELIYTGGLTVNPAVRQLKDVDNKIFEKKVDTVMRMAELLRKALRLTEIQKNIVYRIITEAYTEKQMTNFQNILKFIIQKLQEEQEGNAENLNGYAGKNGINILNKMVAFVDQNIFLENENLYWENINAGEITLFDFSFFEDCIQQALLEAVLWDLWNYWTSCGKRRHIMIVLDEFQLIEFDKGSILELMLTQGRKFGINVWLSTQSIIGNFNKRQQKNLSQVGTKIYFRPSSEDIRMLRQSYGVDTAKQLQNLARGECYIDGELLGFGKRTIQMKCFAKIPKI